ncbi:uncharacterized protein [Physcomitrium patens]|uniref:Uncharacterized protein n=1 Tax=Physcomitrium patens TaxID=3218 RepID=A0A7I4CWB6_PHYPA|nr:uncharacterized protein LOC112278471 isoform X1 [Physcomitrium patens]|eukprot:XP_024367784.1 uncharacterized protein LOC112278471 isoform X1 [Physcomitrella patens]
MRFADSDYGSDDPGNSDISDDVHYEASLLNRSSDYTRPRPRFSRFIVDQGGLVFLEGERVMHLLEVDSLVPSPLYDCSWDNCQVNDYPRNLIYVVGQNYVQGTLLKQQPPMLTRVKNLDQRFAFVIIFRGAQEKGNVSENLTQSSSQLKTCVEHKNAFSSVSRSGKPIYE